MKRREEHNIFIGAMIGLAVYELYLYFRKAYVAPPLQAR